MKLSNLIRGIEVLRPFYNDPDGYHAGAEHDVLFMYATDKPLTREAIEALIALGWRQDHWRDVETADDYDQGESWRAFT